MQTSFADEVSLSSIDRYRTDTYFLKVPPILSLYRVSLLPILSVLKPIPILTTLLKGVSLVQEDVMVSLVVVKVRQVHTVNVTVTVLLRMIETEKVDCLTLVMTK